MDLFGFIYERFKIDKTIKIRLIELFGGIGHQAQALTNLGVDYEHYDLVEIDKYAVMSYNALHGTNFTTQDITQYHLKKIDYAYCNIMTYSFPCTDLSLAGKRGGLEKNSGTHSSLLWEVERILTEAEKLPQVLVMENVPQVLTANGFAVWQNFLESLGYKNYTQCLNAKDYGIPQNRNRCFMVSLLGDYYYEFPKPVPLKLILKDMLEVNVDEKYFLTQKMIDKISSWGGYENPIENAKTPDDIIMSTLTTHCGKDSNGMKLIKIKNNTEQGYLLAEEGDGIDISARMEYHRGTVQKGISHTITTDGGNSHGVLVKDTQNYIEWQEKGKYVSDCRAFKENTIGPTITTTPKSKTLLSDLRIRKLTPRECLRLMGWSDSQIDKIPVSDSQKYKQAGNGIVIQVLMAIFKELF